MKKLTLFLLLVLPLSLVSVNCRVVKTLFSKHEKIKADSTISLKVAKAESVVDSSKVKADVQKKRVTKETYSESNVIITVPAKGKIAPVVFNVGSDLVLDSTSTINFLKFRSLSNPANGIDIFENPDKSKTALARISKNGEDTVVDFTSISINQQSSSRETTEDIDSTGETIAQKIINNSIDSSVVKTGQLRQVINNSGKEVKRSSWPMFWWGIVIVGALLLAYIVYLKIKGRLF